MKPGFISFAAMSLMTTTAPAQTLPASNPFAKPSTLPYHAVPFDRIKDAAISPRSMPGWPSSAPGSRASPITWARSISHHRGVQLRQSGRGGSETSRILASLAFPTE